MSIIGLKLHCFNLFAFKGQRLYRCFCFIILSKVLFSQPCCTFFLFPKCYWFEILPSLKIVFVSAFLPNLLDSNTNDCPSLSSAFVVSKLTWIDRDFSRKFIFQFYTEVFQDLMAVVSPALVAEGYAVTCLKSNNK